MQYMSPEQIQGKGADARSNIFAFGAMLYEMLRGKRAFEGKSQLSVASAILDREPELVPTLKPMTPSALEQVVRTCLAKEPDDRFQNTHDLKLPLQWIAASASQAGTPAIVTPRALSEPVSFCSQAIFGRFRRQFWKPWAAPRYCCAVPFIMVAKGSSSPEASFNAAEKIQ